MKRLGKINLITAKKVFNWLRYLSLELCNIIKRDIELFKNNIQCLKLHIAITKKIAELESKKC